MPAYLIGRLRTQDWSWLKEYGPIVAALIEKHEGRYLVRGGNAVSLEGNEEPVDAHVVVEFPSMEKAQAWYDDAEYGPMIALRKAHAETELAIVPGIET